MAGFDHPPPPDTTPGRNPIATAADRSNARLGLVLFAAYLAGYAAYVLVNAFWPAAMDTVVAGGLNLAVLSGMALIVGAIGLALVYAALCRKGGGRDS